MGDNLHRKSWRNSPSIMSMCSPMALWTYLLQYGPVLHSRRCWETVRHRTLLSGVWGYSSCSRRGKIWVFYERTGLVVEHVDLGIRSSFRLVPSLPREFGGKLSCCVNGYSSRRHGSDSFPEIQFG